MAQIDSLEIQITADSQKAVTSLNKLSQSLQNISTSLARVNGSGFDGLTSGIRSLTSAMKSYSESTVKTSDFTRLATQLGKLASIDYSGLYNLSGSITNLAGSTSTLATVGAKTSNITDFAKSLSKLGGVNIERATSNIPALAKAMKELLTTLSQSPNVSKNVTKLTRALADLTKNMSGIKTASTGSAKGLSLFTNSAQKTTSASKGLASAIGKVYASYWLLFRAFSVFGKAVNYASSLTEIQNVVEQTFGQATKSINEFSQTAKNELGMSELTYKQIASRYQAMGGAMDIQSSQVRKVHEGLVNLKEDYKGASNSASGMSVTLTRLAGDMASFYDQDQLDVAKDLEAVYTGMTRPLRKYGIDLTQTTLQEYANAKGMDVKVAKMTQAQKTMLRYQYVLEHTTKAQDDFQRTADSWANQVKLMKQNFISLGTTIGQVFINAFKPWLKILNQVLVAVNNFAIKVANALGNIFGWTYEGNDVGLLSDFEDDASGLADDFGSANKEAKKLKATIMGYDELNVMQSPNDKDGGSGSGDGALGGAMGDLDDSKMGHWEKSYESEIDNLFDLGRKIADTLQKMMEGIDWKSIYEKARNFGKGLAEFLNGLFKPEMFYQVGRTIAGAINTALHFLDSFAEEFDFAQFGLAIANAINGFFDTFDFKLLAESINKWVQGIWTTIKTAVTNTDWKDVLKGLYDFFSTLDIETVALIIGAITIKSIGKFALGTLIPYLSKSIIDALVVKLGSDAGTPIGVALIKAVGNGVASLVKSIPTIFSSVIVSIQNIFTLLSNGMTLNYALTELFGTVATTVAGVVGVIGGAILGIVNFVKMLKDGFSWLNEALMVLGIAIAGIGAVILGVPVSIAGAIAGIVAVVTTAVVVIKDNWSSIKGFFVDLWESIKMIFEPAVNWLKHNIIQPIANFIKEFSNTVKQIFEGIKIIITAVWKYIYTYIDTKFIQPALTKFNVFKTTITNVFNTIKNTVTTIWGILYQHLDSKFITPARAVIDALGTFIKNVFSTVSKFVGNIFVGMINGVIGSIESGINFIVNSLNALLSGFNKVVSWASKVAGKSWGNIELLHTVSLGRVPAFAKGGFPEDGLFMANHNELVGQFSDGRTAVANNQQITEGIRQAVMDGMMQVIMATSGSNDKGGDINLYLDGKVIAQTTYNNLKTMGRQGMIPRFV